MIRSTIKQPKTSISDIWSAYSVGRDYRSLLRSTGHLFRDGRWTGDDDPFHVYRERIRPGIGSVRTFLGGQSLAQTLDFPLDSPEVVYNWRPALTYAYDAHDAFGSYDVLLPDLVVTPTEDFTLDMNGQGTAFIRSNRPGNPAANLGQFVLELRDLPRLPQLFRARAKYFSELGSEYLNVEFGWLPFLSDLRALFRTQKKLRFLVDQLVKNNGKGIRRRSKHRLTTTSDMSDGAVVQNPFPKLGEVDFDFHPAGTISWLDGLNVSGPWMPGYEGTAWTGTSVIEVDQFTDTELWECGTFHYYIPDVLSDEWTGNAVSTLFGVKPSPHILYAVYPWSWLVDWFLNVGDIVSNMSENAVENEVLTNCFTMRTVTVRKEVVVNTEWNDYDNGSTHFNHHMFVPSGSDELHFSLLERNKLRRKASPFGFGLRQNDLTGRQVAILAALAYDRKGGISFSRRMSESF